MDRNDLNNSQSDQLKRTNKGSIIAAAIIMLFFCVGAYLLPTIMIYLGHKSIVAAAVFAILFVLSFFGIFRWHSWNKQRH